jgi:hypothetical protein
MRRRSYIVSSQSTWGTTHLLRGRGELSRDCGRCASTCRAPRETRGEPP